MMTQFSLEDDIFLISLELSITLFNTITLSYAKVHFTITLKITIYKRYKLHTYIHPYDS